MGGTSIDAYRRLVARDPDQYLTDAEARFDSIREGLQKHIVWQNPTTRSKSAISIIYIHGFSASSGEIRPVPDLVADHLRANIFYTRLVGHGLKGDGLALATLPAWLSDIEEAIAIGERIGERVVIMATSTGAALATLALARKPLGHHVAAVILLSPNFGLRARAAFLLTAPFARLIVRAVLGRVRSFEPVNASHATFWTPRYGTQALLPMAQAARLARQTRVEDIESPVLFLYAPEDQVVNPALITRIAKRWGGTKTLIAIDRTGEDRSSHVLAGDALAPHNTIPVTRIICEWLDNTLSRDRTDRTTSR